jgi:peptidoglycan/xylan/chitin deacetylase (PgdA/CDA1 family)
MGFDIVLWSFSVRDWEGPDGKAVAERILSQARPDAIVAGHDRTEWLVDYLDIVIPALRSKGYIFRRISESGRKGVIR